MNLIWHAPTPWLNFSYSIVSRRAIAPIWQTCKTFCYLAHNIQAGTLPGEFPIFTRQYSDETHYAIKSLELLYIATGADTVISCGDVAGLGTLHFHKLNLVSWFPLDQSFLREDERAVLDFVSLKLSMARFSQRILAENGIKSLYVPPSAPAAIFKPGDKKAARARLGWPQDRFIVSCVAAPDKLDRKNLYGQILAFKLFFDRHPDSLLYLHARGDQGMDIENYFRSLSLPPTAVLMPPAVFNFGLVDDTYMATVYQASDVLLAAGRAEGFGLPIVEAQMCGCPVITTHHTGMAENFFAGWKLAGIMDDTQGWMTPNTLDIAAALEEARKERGNKTLQRQAMGAARFDTDRVFEEYWKPALAEIEAMTSRRPGPVRASEQGKAGRKLRKPKAVFV